MNHYVQRVCVRVMRKLQLAPLALQVNPESRTGQMLCPQTTRDIVLVIGLADKIALLNANANLFLKQKGNCQQVIFDPTFHIENTGLCLFLKTIVRTSRSGTGRSSISHAG